AKHFRGDCAKRRYPPLVGDSSPLTSLKRSNFSISSLSHSLVTDVGTAISILRQYFTRVLWTRIQSKSSELAPRIACMSNGSCCSSWSTDLPAIRSGKLVEQVLDN